MKKRSASISVDRKNGSFQLNSHHTVFKSLQQKIQTKLTECKKETMHDFNSLVKLNVLLFKIQVKNRKNGHRKDPVICGTGNLKATSSPAKIIFLFDLKPFSNLKTMIVFTCYFEWFVIYVRINPTLSRTSKWQTLPIQLHFFLNSSCLSVKKKKKIECTGR